MSDLNTRGVAVAKKAGRPKRLPERGMQVRIASDVARMAKLISTANGTDLLTYLTDILRPTIQRDYGKILREFSEESGK